LRPAPNRRMRSGGNAERESAHSRRPRRIVSTFLPVIRESRRSPPGPIRRDSKAMDHRRWSSSRRLSRRFMRRWISRLG
jgi:hypothetical protein